MGLASLKSWHLSKRDVLRICVSMTNDEKMSPMTAIIGWSILGALVYGGYTFLTSLDAPEKSPAEIAEDQKTDARYACRFAVKRQLNDPSSVEWVGQRAWTVRVDGKSYIVLASFRAKNAFGATIFGSAECDVTLVGDEMVVLEITN